jgi:ubiquitin fusion degradation protein 1
VNPQPTPPPTVARRNGPQPLRLPPGKLFFGYEYKPVKKNGEGANADAAEKKKSTFSGAGQTLRKAGKGKNKAEVIELD